MTSCSEEVESLPELEIWRDIDELPTPEADAEENVFLSRTYLRSWLSHLADGTLEMVTLRENNGSAWTFPFVVCTDRLFGKNVTVWKSAGWNSAWYPFSFLPTNQDGIAPFLDYLEREEHRWDGVLVTCTRSLNEKVEREAQARGLATLPWSEKTLPYVAVSGSWDDYWKGLEKWLRVNVGRFLKRADKQGEIRLKKVSTADECAGVLDRFIALHDARWSARGQRSKYVTRERHRQFLESVVLTALEDGRLYFPYLTLDEEPIAMAVCFVEGSKIYYVWPTFDPEHSRLAPGKLLLYHIIRDAFASGLKEVDLGPGADAYKFFWTSEKREVSQILIYRDSLRLWGSYYLLPHLKTGVRLRLENLLGPSAVRRIAGALDRVGLGG